jgi:hypothetical protein
MIRRFSSRSPAHSECFAQLGLCPRATVQMLVMVLTRPVAALTVLDDRIGHVSPDWPWGEDVLSFTHPNLSFL